MIGLIVGGVIGLLGFMFGIRCWLELREWAHQCQRARIAVAYNNKVRFNHSMVEFVEWANALEKDKGARGQAIYVYNKTSLSIIKAQNPPGRIKTMRLRRFREREEKAKAA